MAKSELGQEALFLVHQRYWVSRLTPCLPSTRCVQQPKGQKKQHTWTYFEQVAETTTKKKKAFHSNPLPCPVNIPPGSGQNPATGQRSPTSAANHHAGRRLRRSKKTEPTRKNPGMSRPSLFDPLILNPPSFSTKSSSRILDLTKKTTTKTLEKPLLRRDSTSNLRVCASPNPRPSPL